jgi:methylthioribose-1-phosphate isomerase
LSDIFFLNSKTCILKVKGKHYRTIWLEEGGTSCVKIIDQRFLPHQFVIEDITNFNQMVVAIKDMHLRGAGLIGVAAAYGIYLAILESAKTNNFDANLSKLAKELAETRPTAVNLIWAIERQVAEIAKVNSVDDKIKVAKQTAQLIADEDADSSQSIGVFGVEIIEHISKAKNGGVVNILTHCNAGWLAFADYGTATAPIYEAHKRGIKVHVWVDET